MAYVVKGAQPLSYSFFLMRPQEDPCCSSFLLFPFFSPVNKVIRFAKHSKEVVCRETGRSPLLLGHLGWLFNQDWKAPTPAECNSLLVLPFPNQGETPYQLSKTQVVPVPRTLQCLSSAGHTREQVCHFKKIFFLLSSCWSFKAVS